MSVTRSQFPVRQDPNSAQEENKISKSVQQEHSTKRPFVEWLDLDYSNNSVLKPTDWKLILKEGQKVDGCRQITWKSPEEDEDDQRLWSYRVSEWWDMSHVMLGFFTLY